MAVLGLERFKPNVDKPPEFLRFWALTVAELQGVPARPAVASQEALADGLRLERIAYTSLGGVRIQGYLLRAAQGPGRPLIVHAHGYNERYEVMTGWAQRGFNVFGFDVRGLGRSADASQVSEDGYVLTGIESPERSILRGAVADYLQAVTVARELLSDDTATVCFYGFSFGGGLALMASALSRDPSFVVLGQPSFGWNAERRRLGLAGSTRQINAYLDQFPWRADDVTNTLKYFDTLYFAPLIKAPTLVGIGLDDDVVPSRTVLAVVNHMDCPIEVRLLPVSHRAAMPDSPWREFHEEWLSYAGSGLPHDFGMQNRQVKTLVA